uniref:Light harvesting protein n=1 Tax=Chrysotila roscoffensis TaxID=418908 RepID=UPI003CDF86E9|mmetsp:Transcript_32347/g.70876  ORF Transcript_32347/g.70876 Transcript_32347/m.70876 type:complete len:217 (+) Transcript_32347:444-1094(+)
MTPETICLLLADVVKMISVVLGSLAFNGLVTPAPTRAAVSMSAISPGDIGTTRPLGVFDPLKLMEKNPGKYRRFQEMEIKHGRIAMLATLHVFITGAGYKWPGYCSYLSFPPLKFEDIPAGTLASWAALPQAGWAQIVAVVAILDNSLFAQDPNREPGDVAGDLPWVRYDDPKVKEYKLNIERNNGRAAMMGIIGMMTHEYLTGNPLYPLSYEPVV